MKPLHENNIFLKVYKLKAVHDEMAKYVFSQFFVLYIFRFICALKGDERIFKFSWYFNFIMQMENLTIGTSRQ
jgi:hypothetical protein